MLYIIYILLSFVFVVGNITAQSSNTSCIFSSKISKNIIVDTCKYITLEIEGNLQINYIVFIQDNNKISIPSDAFMKDGNNKFVFTNNKSNLTFKKEYSFSFDLDKEITLELYNTNDKKENSISLKIENTTKYSNLNSNTTASSTQVKKQNSVISFEVGQNVFSDAQKLYAATNGVIQKDILSKYGIENSKKDIFLEHIAILGNHSGGAIAKNLYQGSGILKTDVTNFATGMSRFLVDRARAELNDAFFQRMYKEMEKMPELQALFPLSYAFLMQTNAHNMHMNLELLKVSFEEDIKLLPMNLYYIVGNMDVQAKYPFLQKVHTFFNESDLGQWVDLALYTVISNNGQINPKDLFSIFVHSSQFQKLQDKYTPQLADNAPEQSSIASTSVAKINLLNAIKLAELISNSLLSPESNRYWVSQEEINELFTNEALFKTYIGLLLAKSKFEDYNIKFYDAKGNAFLFADKVEQLYKTGEAGKQYLATLKQMVKDLYSTFAQVDEVGKKLKEANSSDELIEEAYKYYSVFKENINAISNHLIHRGIVGDKLSLDNTIITNYVAPAIDMAYYIKAKKYNLAVNKLLLILQYAYDYNINKNSTALGNEKNYKKSKEDKEFSQFINKFARYGVLIGTVAEAKTSDEVKAAIEASVLPVGSSRIKRHSRYSISLNAYVGAFYGQGFYKEEIGGILEKQTVQTFGITAPIGVSFNVGSLGFKQKSSLSLTMQIIDLGALVNFYAKNGDGASLPAETKIQFGDILAPGAQLTYSLGDSPFSLIGGIQYVPNLSRMSDISTNTNFTPIAYRLQVGLVIDIPLFNLKVWEK